MCPEVKVFTPAVAITGSSIHVLTFVTTKPRPPLNGVSVSIESPMMEDSPVVPSDALYSMPHDMNNYTFVHTIHLPLRTSQERYRVLISVDVSGVPHDAAACSSVDTRVVSTSLIQGMGVNSISSVCAGSGVIGLAREFRVVDPIPYN